MVIHNLVSSPPKYQGNVQRKELYREGYQGWILRKEGRKPRKKGDQGRIPRKAGRKATTEGEEDVEGGRMSKKEGRRYSF